MRGKLTANVIDGFRVMPDFTVVPVLLYSDQISETTQWWTNSQGERVIVDDRERGDWFTRRDDAVQIAMERAKSAEDAAAEAYRRAIHLCHAATLVWQSHHMNSANEAKIARRAATRSVKLAKGPSCDT